MTTIVAWMDLLSECCQRNGGLPAPAGKLTNDPSTVDAIWEPVTRRFTRCDDPDRRFHTPPGSAELRYRTPGATRIAGGTDPRPHVHQRLVPRIGPLTGEETLRQIPDLPFRSHVDGRRHMPEQPREGASYVDIDQRNLCSECRATKGVHRVSAEARKRRQTLLIFRHPSPVFRHNGSGKPMKTHRAVVVAKSTPGLDDRPLLRARKRWERGESVKELRVFPEYTVYLGLLQHDFGNEDAVRVRGVPPRQPAAMPCIPPEKR